MGEFYDWIFEQDQIVHEKRDGRKSRNKYGFDDLEIGDTITIKLDHNKDLDKQRQRIASSASQYNRIHSKKIKTKRINSLEIKLTRIS